MSLFSSKKEPKEDKVKLEPKSPSVVRSHNDSVKHDKWKQEEARKADKMAKKALEEEDSAALPLAVRQLELCSPPTRRHTQFLLSGYLAVKTSGGWTRKWQCRHVVLTPTFLYVYKRAPHPTEGTFAAGPSISQSQSASVVNTSTLEKEKGLVADNDVISAERLTKLMATADTTDDGSHELFGLIRESIPIDSNTAIMEVAQLPNTFCLSFPDCPRLLLRAANPEQFSLWMHNIQSTILLRSCPPHQIQSLLARKSADEVNASADIVPYVDQLLPLFTDRSSVIGQVTYHHTNQSIYTDLSLLNKDQSATNVPLPSATPTPATASQIPAQQAVSKDVINSAAINTSIIQQQYVNLNVTPSQGAVITNFTPFGQKINIVLNQLPPINTGFTSATSGASAQQILEQSTKDHSITLSLGDGGFVTIPIDSLYTLYQQHQQRAKQYTATPAPTTPAPTTPAPTTPTDDNKEVRFTEQYADALYTVSNSLYNADIHLAFKFSSLASSRKDATAGSKGKKLTARQQQQLKEQQDKALEELRNSNTPPINGFNGLLALIASSYIAYTLHTVAPIHTNVEMATLWLTYLVLTLFTLSMANVTFKSSQRRQSLAKDRDAITKMVNLSGFQQTQLSSTMAAASATSSAPAAPNDAIPVLEIVPIRLVDRHTITGAVLLAGSRFEHETFPQLPTRVQFAPQISLLKALHSNNVIGGAKALDPIQQVGSFTLESDDSDSGSDGDEDEVFETDPVLGNVYAETWGRWCQSDYRGIVLRGTDYLTNKKKPKIPALPHRFQSCHCSIIALKEAQPHCARWNNSYFRKQRQKAIELGKGDLWKAGTPLKYLVVNKMVPGSPNYNFCMYFRNPYIYPSPYPDDIQRNHQQNFHPLFPNTSAVVYPSQMDGSSDPLATLISDFSTKDDAYRKSRFKYIPNVAEGAWFVKKTVGQTPVILGNKLTQSYHLDPHGQYVEVDVDVGSSSVAGSILGVVKGYAKTLAIDLNFLLEPHSPDELPEALWGGVRIINVDLNAIELIEVSHGPSDD